nr:MAG TPA: hypothetical protein [Caudoviricetes sp.]DAO67706.1 MAG TPA: hypothetical protein [Caudoviricetes sp.]
MRKKEGKHHQPLPCLFVLFTVTCNFTRPLQMYILFRIIPNKNQ